MLTAQSRHRILIGISCVQLNPWAFAEPDGAALTGIREALEVQLFY